MEHANQHLNEPRTERIAELPSPSALRAQLPVSQASRALVAHSRREIEAVLDGRDRRLLCIVGPCSLHDRSSALEYAERLAALRARFADELVICMRAYFEKARTTVGWKGLLNDPALDGSCDLARGLHVARELLCALTTLGVPAATETLDPGASHYLAELVSWTSIGARTTESQTHRELASGLPMPVGFKNGTDGALDVAICAMQAARAPHSFIGSDERGQTAVLRTSGHQHTHVVLRGGRGQPNYREPELARACAELAQKQLDPRVLIDCSHGNSGYQPANQARIASELAQRIGEGELRLLGLMLESHLVAGRQQLVPGRALVYGQSITDACLDFATTETLLSELASAHRRARRSHAPRRGELAAE